MTTDTTGRYTKKPVTIDAMQWDGTESGCQAIKAKFPQLETLAKSGHLKKPEVTYWKIGTLEGGHEVTKGDWIIRGVKGEFYPCKPDVFEMTYQPADATHALRAAQRPQADAEWLKELERLAVRYGNSCTAMGEDWSRVRQEKVQEDRAALMAHAAQRPAAQPVKRTAICPETDTPCSTCPTLRIPCEAATQDSRAAPLSEHIEQRLRTWRQSFMSRSGDHLAIDDFMDAQSLDDLVDFVCDEFALAPALASRPVPPPASDAVDVLAELIACNDLKERAEGIAFAGPMSEFGNDWETKFRDMRNEYIRRQHLAWAKACAIIAMRDAYTKESGQ